MIKFNKNNTHAIINKLIVSALYNAIDQRLYDCIDSELSAAQVYTFLMCQEKYSTTQLEQLTGDQLYALCHLQWCLDYFIAASFLPKLDLYGKLL